MLVMWDAFATSESSTAALAFLMGWFIGVPVSVALVLVTRVRLSRGVGGRRASPGESSREPAQPCD
jgi:hypothetical protein